ncbi:MAG: hypothetical protein R6U98_32840 [Pirellulaceae bacterium]
MRDLDWRCAVRAGVKASVGRWTIVWVGTLSVLALTLAGCGASSVETVPVSGTVTVDGEPAESIMVNFQPAEGTTGPGSVGVTSADGTYSLETVGSDSKPGAVVGKHTVSLAYKDPDEDSTVDYQPDPDEPPVMLPPEAYDQSITFEVPAEGTDSADFDLESLK